jgi:hypothetical protein
MSAGAFSPDRVLAASRNAFHVTRRTNVYRRGTVPGASRLYHAKNPALDSWPAKRSGAARPMQRPFLLRPIRYGADSRFRTDYGGQAVWAPVQPDIPTVLPTSLSPMLVSTALTSARTGAPRLDL